MGSTSTISSSSDFSCETFQVDTASTNLATAKDAVKDVLALINRLRIEISDLNDDLADLNRRLTQLTSKRPHRSAYPSETLFQQAISVHKQNVDELRRKITAKKDAISDKTTQLKTEEFNLKAAEAKVKEAEEKLEQAKKKEAKKKKTKQEQTPKKDAPPYSTSWKPDAVKSKSKSMVLGFGISFLDDLFSKDPAPKKIPRTQSKDTLESAPENANYMIHSPSLDHGLAAEGSSKSEEVKGSIWDSEGFEGGSRVVTSIAGQVFRRGAKKLADKTPVDKNPVAVRTPVVIKTPINSEKFPQSFLDSNNYGKVSKHTGNTMKRDIMEAVTEEMGKLDEKLKKYGGVNYEILHRQKGEKWKDFENIHKLKKFKDPDLTLSSSAKVYKENDFVYIRTKDFGGKTGIDIAKVGKQSYPEGGTGSGFASRMDCSKYKDVDLFGKRVRANSNKKLMMNDFLVVKIEIPKDANGKVIKNAFNIIDVENNIRDNFKKRKYRLREDYQYKTVMDDPELEEVHKKLSTKDYEELRELDELKKDILEEKPGSDDYIELQKEYENRLKTLCNNHDEIDREELLNSAKNSDEVAELSKKVGKENLDEVLGKLDDSTSLKNLKKQISDLDADEGKRLCSLIGKMDKDVVCKSLQDPNATESLLKLTRGLDDKSAKSAAKVFEKALGKLDDSTSLAEFTKQLNKLDDADEGKRLCSLIGKMDKDVVCKGLQDPDTTKYLLELAGKLDNESAKSAAKVLGVLDKGSLDWLLKITVKVPAAALKKTMKVIGSAVDTVGAKVVGGAFKMLSGVLGKMGVAMSEEAAEKVLKTLAKVIPFAGTVPGLVDTGRYAMEAKDFHGKNADLAMLATVGASINGVDSVLGVVLSATGVGAAADVGIGIGFAIVEIVLDLAFESEKAKYEANPDNYKAPGWMKAVNLSFALAAFPSGSGLLLANYGVDGTADLVKWGIDNGVEGADKLVTSLRDLGEEGLETLGKLADQGVDAAQDVLSAMGKTIQNATDGRITMGGHVYDINPLW